MSQNFEGNQPLPEEISPPVLVMGLGPNDSIPLDAFLRVPETTKQSVEITDLDDREAEALEARFKELARRLALTAVNLGDFGIVEQRIKELQNVEPHFAFKLTFETISEIDLLPDSQAKELGGTVLAGVMGNLIRESVGEGEDGTITPLFGEEDILRLSDNLSPTRLERIAHVLERSGTKYLALAPYYEVTGPKVDENVPAKEQITEVTVDNVQEEIDLELVQILEARFAQAVSPAETQEMYESLSDSPERKIAYNLSLRQKIDSVDSFDIEKTYTWFEIGQAGEGSHELAQAYDNKLHIMATHYSAQYPGRPDIMYAFITELSPQLDTTKELLWQLVQKASDILKETTGKDPRMGDGTPIPIPPSTSENKIEASPEVNKIHSPPLKFNGSSAEVLNPSSITDEEVERVRETLFSEHIIKVTLSPEQANQIADELPKNPEITHVYNQLILERMLGESLDEMVAWFGVRRIDESTESLLKKVYDDRLVKEVLIQENDGNGLVKFIDLLKNYEAHDPKVNKELKVKLSISEKRYEAKYGIKWQPVDRNGQIKFF